MNSPSRSRSNSPVLRPSSPSYRARHHRLRVQPPYRVELRRRRHRVAQHPHTLRDVGGGRHRRIPRNRGDVGRPPSYVDSSSSSDSSSPTSAMGSLSSVIASTSSFSSMAATTTIPATRIDALKAMLQQPSSMTTRSSSAAQGRLLETFIDLADMSPVIPIPSSTGALIQPPLRSLPSRRSTGHALQPSEPINLSLRVPPRQHSSTTMTATIQPHGALVDENSNDSSSLSSIGAEHRRVQVGSTAILTNTIPTPARGIDAALRAATDTADEECAICKDEKVDKSVLLPCMHTYCFSCINQWVCINPICPLCKGPAERIIHEISSDQQFREVRVADLLSSRRGQGFLELPFGMMRFVSNGHRGSRFRFGLSRSQLPDFSSANIFTEYRSSGTVESNQNITINSLVSRVFSASAPYSGTVRPLEPLLLRRLVYGLNLYSWPFCCTRTPSNSLLDLSPQAINLAQYEASHARLIDFTRRELVALAPWIPYRSSGTVESASVMAPLSSGIPPCPAVDDLAQLIVSDLACGGENGQLSLARTTEFARAIRLHDRGALLTSVGDSELIHFAWEMYQFARFNGTREQYDAQTCLFPPGAVNAVGDSFEVQDMRVPIQSEALYTSPESVRHPSAVSGLSEQHRHLQSDVFVLINSVFFGTFAPAQASNGGIRQQLYGSPPAPESVLSACAELRTLTLYDPRDFLNTSRSVQARRRRAARSLLVRLAEAPWPANLCQLALSELLDQARLAQTFLRADTGIISRSLHNAMRRFANINLLFSLPLSYVSADLPLPQVNERPSPGRRFLSYWSPLRLSPRPEPDHQPAVSYESARIVSVEEEVENVEIDMVDDEDEEQQQTRQPSLSIPEEIVVSDTEEMIPQISQEDQHPEGDSSQHHPCCSSHMNHCCCCRHRQQRGDVAGLFEEFTRFYEARKRRLAEAAVRVSNRPSSPIIISDDDNDDSHVTNEVVVAVTEPQPGPSRPIIDTHTPQSTNTPQEEVSMDVVQEQSDDDEAIEKPNAPITDAFIHRPQTAADFYTLVNELVSNEDAASENAGLCEQREPEVSQEPSRPASVL